MNQTRSRIFTEGHGTAGRLYERLRKRSLRSRHRHPAGRYLARGRVFRLMPWTNLAHHAYVAGLRDGIQGCLELQDAGILY